MVGVILSSYVAIVLGVLLLAAGYVVQRRGNAYGRHLLGTGAVLVVLGVVALLWFVRAFG